MGVSTAWLGRPRLYPPAQAARIAFERHRALPRISGRQLFVCRLASVEITACSPLHQYARLKLVFFLLPKYSGHVKLLIIIRKSAWSAGETKKSRLLLCLWDNLQRIDSGSCARREEVPRIGADGFTFLNRLRLNFSRRNKSVSVSLQVHVFCALCSRIPGRHMLWFDFTALKDKCTFSVLGRV